MCVWDDNDEGRPVNGSVVGQHEARYSVGGGDVGGGARESNLDKSMMWSPKKVSKKDKKVSSCNNISFDVNLDRCRSPGDEVSKLSLSNSLKAFVHLTFRLGSNLISRTVCVHFSILRMFLRQTDLGWVHLPLDNVENGDVAILVCSAQVLLYAGAHLWRYNFDQKVHFPASITIMFLGCRSLLMTSRTVVLRTLAKSWSEVKGVNPVIKKWSLQ